MGHALLGRRPSGTRKMPRQTVIAAVEPVVELPPLPAVAPTPTELDVTAVIINFKTIDLTRDAVQTFRKAYPELPMILVDNGSQDASTQLVRKFGKRDNIMAIMNQENRGHGVAINQAIERVTTKYVFLMDSDCVVKNGDFLQKMIELLKEENLYATGWLRWVDKLSGVPREWHLKTPPSNRFIPYIHPAASLYSVGVFRQLPAAEHHGAPLLANMREAAARGLKVKAFPIFNYVTHLIAGTRRMFGGHWDGTDKKPSEWRKGSRYPI